MLWPHVFYKSFADAKALLLTTQGKLLHVNLYVNKHIAQGNNNFPVFPYSSLLGVCIPPFQSPAFLLPVSLVHVIFIELGGGFRTAGSDDLDQAGVRTITGKQTSTK